MSKDEISKLPTVDVLGVKCWTPSVAAKAIGMHRNTLLGWARKTRKQEMDMPMVGGKTKRSKVFIPVDRFIDWYSYI